MYLVGALAAAFTAVQAFAAVAQLVVSAQQEPAPPPAVSNVTEVTVVVIAGKGCALTVPGEGGPTPTVHPPSAPEGPGQQEHTMSVYQGQHVTAEFPDATVEAIILEVRRDQALVQQKGTQRAEWIPLRDLR